MQVHIIHAKLSNNIKFVVTPLGSTDMYLFMNYNYILNMQTLQKKSKILSLVYGCANLFASALCLPRLGFFFVLYYPYTMVQSSCARNVVHNKYEWRCSLKLMYILGKPLSIQDNGALFIIFTFRKTNWIFCWNNAILKCQLRMHNSKIMWSDDLGIGQV